MISHKKFNDYMVNNFSTDWADLPAPDRDRIYNIALETHKDLEAGTAGPTEELVALSSLMTLDQKGRLEYRMCLAEEGEEWTPTGVDLMIGGLTYAFNLTIE